MRFKVSQLVTRQDLELTQDSIRPEALASGLRIFGILDGGGVHGALPFPEPCAVPGAGRSEESSFEVCGALAEHAEMQ